MDLYEYQGKQLFKRFGIPVSDGRVAATADEARTAAEELGTQVVVKAQVLTGGRGKAGGIKLAGSPDEAAQHAEAILGLDINGHVVRKLWIEQASDIAREYYLSVTFDRGEKKALFMLTKEGGIDIEEVASERPEALARLHVDPLEGFQPYQARRLIYAAGIDDPNEQKQIIAILQRLYDAFVGADAMLCEINPLIVTPEGEVKALDSKFTVDDNALYKHPDIAEMRDLEAYPPEERAAREKGVTYVKLDGEVGILGNGAGLVMSTLDVIALAGGRPANFCDLGGGGDAQGVVDALEIISADPQVKSILFNIFAGITRCDVVAQGMLAGARPDGDRASDRRPFRRNEREPRGGRSSRTRAARTSTSRRRCSRRRSGRWSWRDDGCLVGASRGVPRERRPPRGTRPRALRRVGRRARGSRRRHRRRKRGARPARGRARGRDDRLGAGHAADRRQPRGGIPFADASFDVVACRVAAHHFEDPARRAEGDGPRQPDARARLGQPVHGRGRRGGRQAARPDSRPELLRGRVARDVRAAGSRSRRTSSRTSGSTSRRGSTVGHA